MKLLRVIKTTSKSAQCITVSMMLKSHSLNIKTNVVYIMLFWILFFHSNEFALIVI